MPVQPNLPNDAVRTVLGYLNFSSGASDPKFDAAFDIVVRHLPDLAGRPVYRAVADTLSAELDRIAGEAAFQDVEQARQVIEIALTLLPPAYREHHSDLLQHQSDEVLWQPFTLSRCCRCTAGVGESLQTPEAAVAAVMEKLNDFVGYRPLAVLENGRKHEVYRHERCAAVSLYLREAGTARGPYESLIRGAVEILAATPREFLELAWFDLDLLDELCLDPRAYDFEHPAHQRPNYLFGEWDPDLIDNRGKYRRFVLRQQLLDALLERPANLATPEEDWAFEASAVTAGVMLMASGMTGDGPGAIDSTVKLGQLLPRIATYRDKFYEMLLQRRRVESPEHAERLEAQRREMRQSFGRVRQHLNRSLALRRGRQHVAVRLADLYANLGFSATAKETAQEAATASLRMTTLIRGQLSDADSALLNRSASEALQHVREAYDLLQRGVQCGALVDPWNILGFQGQFSIFGQLENSQPDRRIDELISLVREILARGAKVWSEAAASGDQATAGEVAGLLEGQAAWWDQFASSQVSSVDGFVAADVVRSAGRVAEVLAAWRLSGQSAADVAFWRPYVERFETARSFSEIVDALLARSDFVASMALLMQWLSRSDELPLQQGRNSLWSLSHRWMSELFDAKDDETVEPWPLAAKFIDYLEANAGEYWEAPMWETQGLRRPRGDEDLPEDLEDADEEGEVFDAAYENVVYRDSTDDGFDAGVMDEWGPTELESEHEYSRIGLRLQFLRGVARLVGRITEESSGGAEKATDALNPRIASWHEHLLHVERGLTALLYELFDHKLSPSGLTAPMLAEFDRQRIAKEQLQDQIQVAILDFRDATWRTYCTSQRLDSAAERPHWLGEHTAALLTQSEENTNPDETWRLALDAFADQPLLYQPLSRGGTPKELLAAKTRLLLIERLLEHAPTQGRLYETCRLLDVVMLMEQIRVAPGGAFSEFDRIFFVACSGLVRSIARSSAANCTPATDVVNMLDSWSQVLLRRWLSHSQGLRLSAVEKLSWKATKAFVEKYGADLFSQDFLRLSRLRTIRSLGAEAFMSEAVEREDDDAPALVGAIAAGEISLEEAARHLSQIVDSILEHYEHYREYNATTTLSDRGDSIYVFLDFLRLLAAYDRISWNLAPVSLIHEILSEEGRFDEADLWRDAIVGRTRDAAVDHLRRYDKLCEKYGVQLPSIRQRLEERFIQPLRVHRLRSLLKAAVVEIEPQRNESFAGLQAEIESLRQETVPVGGEAPPWVLQLERELAKIKRREHAPKDAKAERTYAVLTWEQMQDQLARWQDDQPPWE